MPDIKTSLTSKVHYHKVGSGPVIVLLHGFPFDSSLWRKIIPQLAQNYTVIAPDFPGCGGSLLENETSINDLADVVNEILEYERVSKAIIAGHSMGGYVAFSVLDQFSERVCGISVIHSIPAADDEEKKEQRRKIIQIIRNGGRDTFIRQMVPNLFSSEFKLYHPEIVIEQTEKSLLIADDALINFYNGMMKRADYSELLKKSTFPVQWIIGKQDNVLVYKKIFNYSYLSTINFVTCIEQCGHMSMLETPELLLNKISDFANYCFEKNK